MKLTIKKLKQMIKEELGRLGEDQSMLPQTQDAYDAEHAPYSDLNSCLEDGLSPEECQKLVARVLKIGMDPEDYANAEARGWSMQAETKRKQN